MPNKNNISIFSILSSAALFICIVIRVLSCILKSNTAVNLVFYAAVVITLLLVFYRSFSQNEYNRACDLKAQLKAYAICASLGFMTEFIGSVIQASALADAGYFNIAVMTAICAKGLFALLSSLYFIAVSLSCGKTAYDYKNLKILHFAPLFWAICAIITVIPNAPNFKTEVSGVLAAVTLIFAAVFFYSFITELENNGSAKKLTVFSSKAFSYLCLLLFISKAFEIITKTAELNNTESLFALSALLIGFFAYYYRKGLSDFS